MKRGGGGRCGAGRGRPRPRATGGRRRSDTYEEAGGRTEGGRKGGEVPDEATRFVPGPGGAGRGGAAASGPTSLLSDVAMENNYGAR